MGIRKQECSRCGCDRRHMVIHTEQSPGQRLEYKRTCLRCTVVVVLMQEGESLSREQDRILLKMRDSE